MSILGFEGLEEVAQNVFRALHHLAKSRRLLRTEASTKAAQKVILDLFETGGGAEMVMAVFAVTAPAPPAPPDIPPDEVNFDGLLLMFYFILRTSSAKRENWKLWDCPSATECLANKILNHVFNPPPHFRPRSMLRLHDFADVVKQVAYHKWPNLWVVLLTPNGLANKTDVDFEAAVIVLTVVRDLCGDAHPNEFNEETVQSADGLTPQRRDQIRYGIQVSTTPIIVPTLRYLMARIRGCTGGLGCRAVGHMSKERLLDLMGRGADFTKGRTEREFEAIVNLWVEAVRALSHVVGPLRIVEPDLTIFLTAYFPPISVHTFLPPFSVLPP